MIRQHDFNTQWWGAPVGITDSEDVLHLQESELAARCASYDWVEARVRVDNSSSFLAVATNGFRWVDLQLAYRSQLSRVAQLPSGTELMTADRADLGGFDDFAPFSSERYAHLPGVDATRLAARYVSWARTLVAAQPASCAAVHHRGERAGYVFGHVDGTRATFTLAVAKQGSVVPGFVIYLAAANLFRSLGARSMVSALSATNVAALNAHRDLQCTFTSATAVWIRLADHCISR